MKRSAGVMSFVLACAVTPVIAQQASAQTQPANPETPPATAGNSNLSFFQKLMVVEGVSAGRKMPLDCASFTGAKARGFWKVSALA
jgi:hypothetical protein